MLPMLPEVQLAAAASQQSASAKAAAAVEAAPSSLHEAMVQQLRRLGFVQLGCALGLTLPAAGLAALATLGLAGDGAVVHGLVATLALASLLLQLAVVMRQLHATDENRIAWLGVILQPLNRELARFNDLSEHTRDGKTGAMVSFVYPGSPADKAGVKVGQFLLRLRELEKDEPELGGDTRWVHDTNIPELVADDDDGLL